MADPAPDQPPPPLGYAPRPPQLQRRSTVRWVCAAIVLVTLIAAGTLWGPLAWRRLVILYWQHRCLAFAASPDALAFDTDAAVGPTAQSAAFQAFYKLLSPPGDRGAPVVYTHELRTPSGASRLVVVQAYVFTDGAQGDGWSPDAISLMVTFSARVFRPGGLTTPPSQVLARDTGSTVIGASRPTQVHAGQPDPNDPTHFTLTGTSAGRPFTVDGWLQDDETVAMDLRAKRPRPSSAHAR